MYAITTHLSIERDVLLGMAPTEVVEMARENGDVITESRVTDIIECAKAEKAREEEGAERAARKAEREAERAARKATSKSEHAE